jgi:hypothetical protein
MYFWQCYGAKAARAASLWVQLPKRGPQLNRQINDIATILAARIWVQGGKVMGFVALFFFCDWTRTFAVAAGLWGPPPSKAAV